MKPPETEDWRRVVGGLIRVRATEFPDRYCKVCAMWLDPRPLPSGRQRMYGRKYCSDKCKITAFKKKRRGA